MIWAGQCDDVHMTTHEQLQAAMEFDHVVEVHADGTVTDAPSDLDAPEVYDDDVSGGWVLLKGHTGQYGYNGPTMHASEQIGGGLADAILSTPGYYVVVMSYVVGDCEGEHGGECDDDHVAGWAIAFRPSQEG